MKTYVVLVIGFLLLKLGFIFHHDLLVEEAYYWNYAQHLDWSYLDHPPMVAWLIKLGILVGGNQEWAVRLWTLPCWLASAFFSFRFSQLLYPGSGRYTILLLSFLPFFFIHSLIITPDVPLIVCWSALLYFLYQAIALDRSHAWYYAGIALGLGMLSKYTIVLMVFTTFFYLLMQTKTRILFRRNEPYLAALIALFIFTPVLYWNYSHDWISFAFQSTRRLEEGYSFSLDSLLAFSILFLTPVGVWGAGKLLKSPSSPQRLFILVYTLIPFAVFVVFSLLHAIKFNWIGPVFLALLPWLAHLMAENQNKMLLHFYRTAWVLLLGLTALFSVLYTGYPSQADTRLFFKWVNWKNLTQQMDLIAKQTQLTYQEKPLIVPMDSYNIGSEFLFYQAQRQPEQFYDLIGSHLFGCHSVMFNYWTKKESAQGRILILFSNETQRFDNSEIRRLSTALSPIHPFPTYTQSGKNQVRDYYYQVVRML